MTDDDKVNILLVDDEPGKLLSYEVMLGELGQNLIKARSAQEALEQLLKKDIALILIDVCMPELDGFGLASMIREHPRFERTAIIFVSAIQLTDLDRLRGYECGAVDYVPIPVVPALLRAKVNVFCELYRKTRQLELLNGQLELRVAERTVELERTNAELEQRVEERTREREAALAQVHEMQKLESLGQLTGGVAHDFNNLLMAVLGNLDVLRHRIPDEEKYKRLLEGAIAGAERGAALTKRMLAFARRQELKPEAVDAARISDGMLDMLRRSLGPTILITTEFEADLPPVCVDPNQLELALLNLALNARDAMPLGGPLVVAAHRAEVAAGNPQKLAPGAYVRLAVVDSGAGMDEKTLERATEPFFTTKGLGKGTGLGLSMVHGFALQSGGAMRITSTVGTGTKVELWLQTAQPESSIDSGGPAALANRPARHCRVLIVDDDTLVLETLAAMLENLGHQVVEAVSAGAALALLETDSAFDLLITDQAMPTMTGTELRRRIRESWPDLPILLVTGNADLAGVDDPGLVKLMKPYLQEDLAAHIEELLQGRPATNLIPFDRARRA